MLTGPRSGDITGAVLPVDGGWTCHRFQLPAG